MQKEQKRLTVYIITQPSIPKEALVAAGTISNILLRYYSATEIFTFIQDKTDMTIPSGQVNFGYLSDYIRKTMEFDKFTEFRILVDDPSMYITLALQFNRAGDYRLAYECLMGAYLNKLGGISKELGEREKSLKEGFKTWKDIVAQKPRTAKCYFISYQYRGSKECGNTVVSENPFVWESKNLNSKVMLSWKEMTEEDQNNYIPF